MLASTAAQGYVVTEKFISADLALTLYATFLLREHRGETKHDEQVPGAVSFWGDTTLDALLVTLRPQVERACGLALLPTYCYGRLYRRGDALRRHIDRPEAEIVATIHLGHHGAAPEPICFRAPGTDQVVAVRQRPGDAVVFMGSRLEHWRAPYDGERFGQVFLNYVRTDGPHAGRALDGRVGAFPTTLLQG